jgi:hypothetical protein
LNGETAVDERDLETLQGAEGAVAAAYSQLRAVTGETRITAMLYKAQKNIGQIRVKHWKRLRSTRAA